MKITMLLAILFLGATKIVAQNPVGFDTKCNDYISKTIPLSYPTQLYSILNQPTVVILDAREIDEYNVSHIPHAINIGFNNFNKTKLNNVSITDSIYIYCSIGYRSEKIGEKLVQQGYKNVFNLYGGIFNWVNSGYKVIDNNNKTIKEVHGYNEEWSEMVNNKKCTIVLTD